MFKEIIIFIASIGVVGQVFAQTITSGEGLKYACNYAIKIDDNNGFAPNYLDASNEYELSGTCFGYLTCLNDLSVGKSLYCLPSNFTNIQLARILVKYLNDNPKYLSQEAYLSVVASLHEAFPCKKD
jgi:hypothetical protein